MFNRIPFIIFSIFLFISTIYFFNYHYNIIVCPYSLEYREGASLLPTYLLLHGINPFDYSNNPQFTNGYGILYNLLLFPLAKIWGPTLLLHRILTGFFLITCCLIIIAALLKNKTPILLSLTGGLLLYPFLLYPGTTTPCAGPHTLGLFLFLMGFFTPYFLNYSKTSLIISALMGILAFYTKPYFLLCIPLTASYVFLFKSKKNGLLFGIIFLVFFIFSIYITDVLMKCYFNNIFYAGANGVVPSINHAILELTNFYKFQKPLFLLMGICLILQGVNFIKHFKAISLKEFTNKIKLLSWEEPLFNCNFNVNLYGLIITTLTIYFFLGRNNGQLMGYPFQLMSPFFIAYLLYCLNKHKSTLLIGLTLIIITFFSLYSSFPKNFHEFDHNWSVVETIIKKNTNIFSSPVLVPFLIKHHRIVYDSGHSEFFAFGINRKFFNLEFPSQPEILERNNQYSKEVWLLVTQKKFDLLIMRPTNHPFMPDLCGLYYRPIGAIKLKSFHFNQNFDLIVWAPQ